MKQKIRAIFLTIFVFLLITPFSISSEEKSKPTEKKQNLSQNPNEGFTINFQSVTMLEYLRFVSKVCQVNFIYDENDLKFTITIVSEEKISPNHLMSTLMQMLRIHGFAMVEENNSFVIHKNDDVKSLGAVVNEKEKSSAPLITRIFAIKNVNLQSLINVLQPMISKNAFLQTIPEANYLILTDISSNIEKVKSLIDVVDTPTNPLEIETYVPKNGSPAYLIDLSKKILAPLIINHPYYLVAQDMTNTIYLVTTPDLTKKTLALLKKLDVSPSKDQKKTINEENVILHQLHYKTPGEIETYLSEISKNLKKVGFVETPLIHAMDSMFWVEGTSTLIFTGNKIALDKLKEILSSLDVKEEFTGVVDGVSHFLSYLPQNINGETLIRSLKEIAKNLDEAKLTDRPLLMAIENVKWIPSINTLLFAGNKESLDQIQTLMSSVDTAKQKEKIAEASTYYLYKLQHTFGNVIEEDLEQFIDKLKTQKGYDRKLVEVLENVKWIKETNSLLISGENSLLKQAVDIITQYDNARQKESLGAADQFLMYKPKVIAPPLLQEKLLDITHQLEKSNLSDPGLIKSLKTAKFVPSSQSLVFTGSQQTIKKVEELLASVDIPKGDIKYEGKTSFLIYPLQHASFDAIIRSLHSVAKDFEKTKSVDKDFISALNSVKFNPHSHALVFTGTDSSLEKIKPLVERFDIPSLAEGTEGAKEDFYIYKPIYISGPSLENILKEFIEHLEGSGFTNDALFQTIQSMTFVEKTNSLLFTGDLKSIEEIKNLLTTFDVPGKDSASIESIQPIDNTSFLVYKLQFHKGDEIQTALKQVAKELTQSQAPVQKNLLNAINSVQWIEVTNSLLCSGDQETMVRLKELVKNLDVPLKQVFIEMLVLETSLDNLMQFGLQWGGQGKFKNFLSVGSSNLPADYDNTKTNTFASNLSSITATKTPTGQDVPFQPGFDFGVIGDILMHKGKSYLSLGSLLSALQTDRESTIVMTPKILAQDSKTSELFIGQNIPYIGSTNTVTGGSSSSSLQNLEYRDVGMKLVLTPVLGNADVVTLSISLDNTAEIKNTQGQTVSSGSVQGITTSRTSMNTTVHIPNKHFLILSGMITENRTKIKNGIPCLGGLPLVGHLFSKSDNAKLKDNLVIFIRPHIINSYKDMIKLSENQEDFFRENAGSANLEKIYDESVELLKSVDDEE